jgi:hypothetical protein
MTCDDRGLRAAIVRRCFSLGTIALEGMTTRPKAQRSRTALTDSLSLHTGACCAAIAYAWPCVLCGRRVELALICPRLHLVLCEPFSTFRVPSLCTPSMTSSWHHSVFEVHARPTVPLVGKSQNRQRQPACALNYICCFSRMFYFCHHDFLSTRSLFPGLFVMAPARVRARAAALAQRSRHQIMEREQKTHNDDRRRRVRADINWQPPARSLGAPATTHVCPALVVSATVVTPAGRFLRALCNGPDRAARWVAAQDRDMTSIAARTAQEIDQGFLIPQAGAQVKWEAPVGSARISRRASSYAKPNCLVAIVPLYRA